jgi:hypothetical protein
MPSGLLLELCEIKGSGEGYIILNYINYGLKYPAFLGIEDKVNCYLPTA